jgi:uncharacterized membrane protein
LRKLIKDLLKGKLFGHPVHIMLVQFPSSLFPLSLLADLIAVYTGNHHFYIFSFYSALAGTAVGWLALLLGIVDLIKIPAEHTAFNKTLIHGGLNFLWLTAFTVLVGTEVKYYPSSGYSFIRLVVKTIVVTGLIFSNYIGGELVLKYGIGKKE